MPARRIGLVEALEGVRRDRRPVVTGVVRERDRLVAHLHRSEARRLAVEDDRRLLQTLLDATDRELRAREAEVARLTADLELLRERLA